MKQKHLSKIATAMLTALAASSALMLNSNPVHASSNILPVAVTKIAGTKNYNIYQDISNNGPVKKIATTNTFKTDHLESKEYRKTAKGTYWNLIVNGRSIGWVNQNFFAKNKISLAKHVSLVQNEDDSFNPKDAINYATDSRGTLINPNKVHVSHHKIDTTEGGTYQVQYRYGKAKANLDVKVRSDEDEGVSEATIDPENSYTDQSSWAGHSKGSSTMWNAMHHYGFEEDLNNYESANDPLTLSTRLYQPRFLSLDYNQNDEMSQVGVTPEGIAVKNNQLLVSLFANPKDLHGHLAVYNLNHIISPYNAQRLASMPWNKFKIYSKSISVSPYLKLGHGQALGMTDKYIYVLANNNKEKNSSASEEILQIDKKTMQINNLWSTKTWNGESFAPRYFHNAVFVNDHTAYALFHNASKGRYEYWKLTRDGDKWTSEEVGATNTNFVKNSPVQGFAYDKDNDNFYVGFNDRIFKVDQNGKVQNDYQFSTKRELEGLSVDNNKLYAELTQRAELLKADID